MKVSDRACFVETIKERCRMCYTCVRECPAKAIRIVDGQARVIPERCIGCGNCVRVCSQQAKLVLSSIAQVRELIDKGHRVALCLAPSFPAEFTEVSHKVLVGMIRKLGVTYVNEVAFGADLVSRRYRELMAGNPDDRYIATSCPAVVTYVEKYHPELVPALAPIVSPMLAIARVIKAKYGTDVRVVFAGPCIAKKCEAASRIQPYELDAVLTFRELRQMLADDGITPEQVQPVDFDQPSGGLGGLFSVSRGFLQAAGIREDLLKGDVIATSGRVNFVTALKEFESGDMDARFLEVLCCNGCIMGAGMTSDLPFFRRRSMISQFVDLREREIDLSAWRMAMEEFKDLNLLRRFETNDQRIPSPSRDELAAIMRRLGKFSPSDELNCAACGYDTCREHAVAIFKKLAEDEMCLPYTIERLKKAVAELAVSNDELADTREALMHSERLASMGQLAAGIAHEVNNPLGVVLMYAHILLDEYGQDRRMGEDLGLIAEQADRCKKIVAGLLHFARQNKVVHEATDVGDLIGRNLKTLNAPDNVEVRFEMDTRDPVAEIDRDQIGQVLTNLMVNAVTAMPNGGTLTVRLRGDTGSIYIEVSDTGFGIPKENMKKIFEPFFTTKQIGKGTGLGLAVTYGIVKMHRGDINVVSNADPKEGPTGATFTVTLPRVEEQDATVDPEKAIEKSFLI